MAGFVAAAAAGVALQLASASADDDVAGKFDFYVLSLSWSPSYCAAEGADANRQQCGQGKAYSFIVHGLWPEFEKGWPQYCASHEPERVPDRLASRYYDIVPSAALIGHMWRKHGSCSGLSQADYLAKVRAARHRVTIPGGLDGATSGSRVDPQAVEASFRAANAGLPADGIAVTCEGGNLRDVRICMTRDLKFRPCAEIDADGCRVPSIDMPPPGG